MSRENVEIIRSSFSAFERGELDKVLAAMSDDLITHRPALDDAIFHGKEGFLQATADWIENFEDWTLTLQEFLDAGESVVVRTHQTGRGETSGAEVEMHIWFVFEMRKGKVTRVSFHFREADALEAGGIPG